MCHSQHHNLPIYMNAHFRWTKTIHFCEKCKNNNKKFLGCFPTAFIDDPSLKKLNASRKGLRAHVVMIHRRSVQRSLHLQRNTYNHTNIRTYTLKRSLSCVHERVCKEIHTNIQTHMLKKHHS